MNTPTNKIIVKAKAERGRWRAGLHFTREAVELDTGALSEAQGEAIAADPELIVEFIGSADWRSPKQIKADDEALARERAATKSKDGKKAWAAAETAAREKMGVVPDHWANLADSDRVARIEAVLAEAAGK